MIQLSYQPAFDTLHAVFRALRLLPIISRAKCLPVEKVRILDFFLLFPHLIKNIRLKKGDTRFRKLAKLYEDAKPYGEQPENRALFERMEAMQIAALQTLSTNGYLAAESLKLGTAEAISTELHPDLAARISALNRSQSDLIEFLEVLALEYSLLGPQGLKDRTGLLEYRYDAV